MQGKNGCPIGNTAVTEVTEQQSFKGNSGSNYIEKDVSWTGRIIHAVFVDPPWAALVALGNVTKTVTVKGLPSTGLRKPQPCTCM
jgi:hypothetical protein